jgi:hypothetical protein
MLVGLCLLVACSSESSGNDSSNHDGGLRTAVVGEACDDGGKTEGECEVGGICGTDAAGKLLCLKICTDPRQCAATEDCNGVEGANLKGCRPK